MVTSNQNIRLIVTKNELETPNYRSIYFQRPANFVFEAGDWIDIEFNGRVLKGGKTFSLASSPTEPELRITLRDGISEFKLALAAAKPGDELIITQFGNDYDFQLNKHRSSMLIAGGVGIAPFRSMLKEMYDHRSKTDVALLYLNQNKSFLFKDELETWSRMLPNLTITYIITNDINRKKREAIVRSIIKNTHQNFYISGPPSMVESNEHLLIDIGVPVRNIRIDSFGGY